MFLVSPLLDKYFRSRLQSKEVREKYYGKAIRKELRHSKLGVIALRNLNELMAQNTDWHREFAEQLDGKNYQEVFWESDLGYLWYQGNLHAKNKYFSLALEAIQKNKYKSILDVGCGWGEFVSKAAACPSVSRALGVDISADIIAKATSMYKDQKVSFVHKDILEVKEQFDLITVFGSTDYIPPAVFPKALEMILLLANKEVIIVNSLRKIPFEKTLQLKEASEILRYDTGYVQPLNYLLGRLQENSNFNFTIEKAGSDSVLVTILKN